MSDSPFDDVDGDLSDMETGNREESMPTPAQGGKTQSKTQGILDYVTATTGNGSLQEYQDTPVNPNNSEGVAHIMRGVSGLMGKKIDDWALIDILQGAFKFSKEHKSDGGDGIETGEKTEA